MEMQEFVINGETMGAKFSIIFFAAEHFDVMPIGDKLQAVVNQIDSQMSKCNLNSDLMRFNQSPCNEWVKMPTNILCMMDEALEIYNRSGGKFDISKMLPNIPLTEKIMAQPCLKLTDILMLDKVKNRLLKTEPIIIDLCDIVKGYAVDKLAECLNQEAIGDYLVLIDRKICTKGAKPDGSAWNIGMKLENSSIASSSDYRFLQEYNGQKITSSTADGLVSVTIMAPECMQADAWATALMDMGEIEAIKFVKLHKMNGLFIVQGENGLTEIGFGCFADKKQV